MMAKVIPIGDPVNEAERRAIAHLRDTLPDNYSILHNFEVIRNEELNQDSSCAQLGASTESELPTAQLCAGK